MTYQPMGGKTYTLASSISSTATTLTLTSFKVPVSDDDVTMALMNTDVAYATIAPKTTSSEFISFTGITQNADGTATLTGVTRGLNKTYPFTEDSDFKLPHSGQSQFIISDAPQVFYKYGAKDNDEVLTGQWEAPDPLTAQGLVTRDWVLALINGGAISINAVIESGNAGETVSANQLLYFSETENEWMKTDADTLATVFNVKLGIAQGAGVNGGAIAGGVLTFGTFTISGATAGDLLYASNTAGGVNSGTAGTTPRVIGIALSSTVGYFDPNFQNFLYNYAVDAVGTDAYAVTLAGAFSAYYPGMLVSFKAGTANTGACTLAVNGGSAKAIKKDVSTDLSTGDILQNQIVLVQYDGTNFQMISLPSGNVANVTNPVLRVYTSSGTWTKPTGLKYIVVEVCGGGGGSGGSTTTANPGGGGGGGGYSKEILAASVLASTEDYVVGAGGTAGAGGGGDAGGTGGTSNFGTTPFLQATGGSGGQGGELAQTVANGGVGSSGTLNVAGGQGSPATNGAELSGMGGNSFFGAGSAGTSVDGAGKTGGVYGGGAGGAYSGGAADTAGAVGGAGVVIVTEFY